MMAATLSWSFGTIGLKIFLIHSSTVSYSNDPEHHPWRTLAPLYPNLLLARSAEWPGVLIWNRISRPRSYYINHWMCLHACACVSVCEMVWSLICFPQPFQLGIFLHPHSPLSNFESHLCFIFVFSQSLKFNSSFLPSTPLCYLLFPFSLTLRSTFSSVSLLSVSVHSSTLFNTMKISGIGCGTCQTLPVILQRIPRPLWVLEKERDYPPIDHSFHGPMNVK